MTSGINYLATPFFTRLLSTEEYGIVSLYNTVYAIMSVVCTLTLARPGVLNVGLYEHKDNRWRYLSNMLGLIAITSAFVGVLLFVFKDLLCSIVKISFSLFILSLLCCIILPATTFWTVKNRYEYDYKLPVIVSVGSALVSQGASLIAVIILRNSGTNLAEVKLWTSNVINMAVAAFLYSYIVKQGKSLIDLKLWKKTLYFAFPLIPHYLGFAFLTGTDKIMISNIVGQDKTGIYSLSAVLSSIGTLLWQAFCISLTPFIHAKLGENNYSSIRKHIKPLLILVAAACLIITLIAPEIVWVMGSSKYLEGIYVVPAVMGGLFMHIMYDSFSAVSFFRKKSVSIMLATIVAAILNIVTNYIFIEKYGYIAAGYTTLFSYAMLAVLHFIISYKVEGAAVFDWKFSLLISIITVILCLSCLFLYESSILRYLIMGGVIVFIIIKRAYFIDDIASMEVK